MANKIFYIANNQLPTIKAHGIQIIKTCEAFATEGIDCELIIPDRPLYPEVKEKDPLKYYSVRSSFQITKIPSRSFVNIKVGAVGSKILFWIQQALFARKVRKYLGFKEGLIYTRDPFVVNSLRKSSYKLFWEAHNLPGQIESGFYRKILSRIDGLIVISKSLKKDFQKYYKKEILIASDGVDLDLFSINISREEARLKTGLPEDKKIVMYVGHLYGWKGVANLINVAEYLDDDYLIVLVGGTPEDIKEQKKDLEGKPFKDKILFVGHKTYDQIPTYLKAADVLVLPNSSREKISNYTSPLKLFEYMASGRPIVASDLFSIREILNSGNSILVQPDSSEALADAIKQILNDQDRSSEIISQAREDVKKFSWQNRAKLIAKYIKIT